MGIITHTITIFCTITGVFLLILSVIPFRRKPPLPLEESPSTVTVLALRVFTASRNLVSPCIRDSFFMGWVVVFWLLPCFGTVGQGLIIFIPVFPFPPLIYSLQFRKKKHKILFLSAICTVVLSLKNYITFNLEFFFFFFLNASYKMLLGETVTMQCEKAICQWILVNSKQRYVNSNWIRIIVYGILTNLAFRKKKRGLI